MEKVLITANFHRYVPAGEGKPERKEVFSIGKTVEVEKDMAAHWIANGLAKRAAHPLDHDGDGNKGGSLAKPR